MPTTEHRGLRLPDGARLTPQRRAILDVVAGAKGAFTAAGVFEEARRKESRLGLATTYRTIELLRETGAVQPLRHGDALYLRCGPDHHHHLVCRVCGAVEDTELCAAPSAGELRRRHGFTPESHDLEIYGTCKACT